MAGTENTHPQTYTGTYRCPLIDFNPPRLSSLGGRNRVFDAEFSAFEKKQPQRCRALLVSSVAAQDYFSGDAADDEEA